MPRHGKQPPSAAATTPVKPLYHGGPLDGTPVDPNYIRTEFTSGSYTPSHVLGGYVWASFIAERARTSY